MNRAIIILFCVSIIASASSKLDYCSENLYRSSATKYNLQFTKELSAFEYGLKSNFKSLHCCAKGYRSVQWFKNGKPYPWASDVSTFILYPEAANQTIYSHSLATSDAGTYSCQITNDSSTVLHEMDLKVFDMSSYSDEPLHTYSLPSEHYIRLGNTARMFCEAYVGKIDLPDADSRITWSRPGMNVSLLMSDKRIRKKDVFRDNHQVLGSYFIIRNVKRSDYGDYICSISNSDDQIIDKKTTVIEMDWPDDKQDYDVPWLKVFIKIACLGVSIICLVSMYQYIVLSSLLCFKNIFQKRNNEDGKIYDILVCYEVSDSNFIKTTLAVTLQKKYGYNVVYKQLTDPALAEMANLSRSILVIGSPGMCNNLWTPYSISNLIQYMCSLSSHVILIPANPIPSGEQLKCEDGRILEAALKKICVVNFSCNNQSNARLFWIRLRLALPSIKSNRRCQTSLEASEFADVSLDEISVPNKSAADKTHFVILTNSSKNFEMLV